MSMGLKIKQLLEEKKISIEEFALKMDMTSGNVYKIFKRLGP